MLHTFLLLLLWASSSLQAKLQNSAERVLEDQPNVQISGGDQAKPHAYPYMVKLLITEYRGGYNTTYNCGGSLISKQYILTAAHCLVTESGGTIVDIKIILGAHNWKDSTEKSHQEFRSTVYVMHERFSSSDMNFYDDIAVIQLPTEAKLTNEVNVVKLPKRSDTSNNYLGEIANLTGWGKIQDSVNFRPAKLRVVSVKVTDSDVCGAEHGTVLKKQLCTAGSRPINKSACLGDSGGPLVINGTQIGIVSYAAPWCETAGWSSVYTKVDQYLDWIAYYSDVNIKLS